MLAPFTPRTAKTISSVFGFTIDNPRKYSFEAVERFNVTDAPILYKKITPKK